MALSRGKSQSSMQEQSHTTDQGGRTAGGQPVGSERQGALRLDPPLPSIAQGRVAREVAAGLARMVRRRALEQRAVELFRQATHAAGVDALAAEISFDRSFLYAQGRGDRPPQLAPFLAALEDPSVGPVVLRQLAQAHRLVLVREESGPRQPRGLADVLADLLDLLDETGFERDVEQVRIGRRAAR